MNEDRIEDLFETLDDTIKQMEKDDVSLEDTFACYEKGVKLVGLINSRIEKIEKQVIVLSGGEEQ